MPAAAEVLARRSGHCKNCSRPIRRGEPIARAAGAWMHSGCAHRYRQILSAHGMTA